MSNSSLADDLSFVRTLAEEGRHAPLLSGRYFVFYGGITAAAYLAHYAIASGLAGLSPNWIAAVWGTFAVLAISGRFALTASFPEHTPGAGSAGNRAEAAAWSAAGAAMGVFFVTAIALVVLGFATSALIDAGLPLVFALYATAMVVGGTMGDDDRIRRAGWTSLVFVVAAVALHGRPEAYLAATVGIITVAVLPGLALLRDEPKSTV
ncbi:MAG: hypothetical protein AAFS03_05040 [Pseudomonadota bacterium]